MDEIVKNYLDDLYQADIKFGDMNYVLRVWMTLMCGGKSIDCFGSNAYYFIKRFSEMNDSQKIIVFEELLNYIGVVTEKKINSYK